MSEKDNRVILEEKRLIKKKKKERKNSMHSFPDEYSHSMTRSGRSPGGGLDNPSRALAQRISWTEEPGRLPSTESQKLPTGLSE